MPRIVGIDLPKEKRIDIALTYLYGIGRSTSAEILEKANVKPEIRAKNLTEDQLTRIVSIVTQGYKIEGDLRREISQNIKRLIDIGSYRGLRHRRGLPVRGQRTHTNARTRKGPRKNLAMRAGAAVKKPSAPAAKT